MPGCSFITYKGKQILYFDHEGLDGADLIKNLELGDKLIHEYPGEDLLVLANFEDTRSAREVMAYFKNPLVRENNKKIVRAAVIGLGGVKNVIVKAYNGINNGKYKIFQTGTQAKEYLVSK